MPETQCLNPTDKEKQFQLGRQIVTLMGPEGSGKTTIAKQLAAATKKPYFTIGDILREMAANDRTEYGNECRAMFAEHRYLHPQMLLDILVTRLKRDDLGEGFILDGGLRTVEEVNGFQSVLERANRVMPVTVINLHIPGWMSIHRLITAEDARKRDDDTVGGVLSRLSNFYNNLSERATLIKNQENWNLVQVNATGTIDETFNKVREVIIAKSEN